MRDAARSRPIPEGTLPIVRAGCWSFATILLVSAWFKSLSPGFAAAALAWTGLEFEHRESLVVASVWVEAGLGALLFTAHRYRSVHATVILLGSALLIVHVAGMTWSQGGCACFGELEIPDWMTLPALLIGIASSGFALRGLSTDSLRPPRWPTWIATVVVTLAAASPILFRDETPAPEQLLYNVNLPDSVTEVVFVIGSFDCQPCEEELERIAKRRKDAKNPGGSSTEDVRVFFVTAAGSSHDLTFNDRFPWLARARIPEHLWRRLSTDGSPTFVHYRSGHPLEFGTARPSPIR